jgi:hypothetical protein
VGREWEDKGKKKFGEMECKWEERNLGEKLRWGMGIFSSPSLTVGGTVGGISKWKRWGVLKCRNLISRII